MSENELTPTEHDVQYVVTTSDGQPEQGLIAITGHTRDAIIASLMNSLATTGKYTPDARAVSSQVLGSTASTVTAVASTAASAAIAPTLFMATANPATLMQLGSGVGSAVMGASGIAAQAPFIPVAASLPVVAPLALMGIVNTAVTMRQFQAVNAKLDTLANTLTHLLVRTDITQIAGLIAASKTLGDITEEYDELGHFTPAMIARFAVAEQALIAVAQRQELLLLSAESRALDTEVPIDDVIRDVNTAGLAYITEVQVHALHLALALQESPALVTKRAQQLTECIDTTNERWSTLKNLSEGIKAKITEYEEEDPKKPWHERMRSSQTHDFPALKERREKILENEKALIDEHGTKLEAFKDLSQNLREQQDSRATLVYWRDEAGEHSFITEHLSIDRTH
ncbi:hypothetical protein [Actinomyces sp.]